jgi:ferrous iron transport protein A
VSTLTLDRLSAGQRGRVLSLRGDDALVQRLMEMGLLEGDEVELVGFAPLGDPLEVRLGDSRLSLRRAEASRVEVQLLP